MFNRIVLYYVKNKVSCDNNARVHKLSKCTVTHIYKRILEIDNTSSSLECSESQTIAKKIICYFCGSFCWNITVRVNARSKICWVIPELGTSCYVKSIYLSGNTLFNA